MGYVSSVLHERTRGRIAYHTLTAALLRPAGTVKEIIIGISDDSIATSQLTRVKRTTKENFMGK